MNAISARKSNILFGTIKNYRKKAPDVVLGAFLFCIYNAERYSSFSSTNLAGDTPIKFSERLTVSFNSCHYPLRLRSSKRYWLIIVSLFY
jgi:hypothetical protein